MSESQSGIRLRHLISRALADYFREVADGHSDAVSWEEWVDHIAAVIEAEYRLDSKEREAPDA